MVGKNPFLQGYNNRKRNFTNLSRKKQIDVQKEMEEDLLMMHEVDKEACWKIYRLEEDNCRAHTVPNPKIKNCKQNPYCIHRLGLEKFEKLQQSPQTPAVLVRRNMTEQPCGLANFGNFCYVNSFLQIWFNDLQFRQCIYDWRSLPEWKSPVAKLDIQTVMECLQRLFITMQFTPFDSTNANEFIQLLRLDNEQQDVQEFHTVFFGTIEHHLEEHPNGGPVLDVIRRLFQSRISQTISCGQCHRESETDGEYRSLQIGIDGYDSLFAAIQAFFEKESLVDCRCDQCGVSGWVSRTSNFAQLPEVLIIQLNRYVFDNTGRHRKLKAPIHYPRTLPISELQPGAEGEAYELCAVMIHEGNNTHCGHYYDLVRDSVNGQWFKYNDKEVLAEKRTPGYAGKSETFPRAAADTKGCYALIYQRMGKNKGDTDLHLPPENIVQEVKNKLEEDFLRQSSEGSRSAQFWTNLIKSKSDILHEFWNELEVHDGRTFVDQPEQIVFLPTSYLSNILSKEYKAIEEFKGTDSEYDYIVEPIDDFEIRLCRHGFIPLDAVHNGELKAVRADAAEMLLKEFNVRYKIIHPVKTPNQIENGETSENHTIEGQNTVGKEQNGINIEDGQPDKEDEDRLRTGADICIECVEKVRKCALFKSTLQRTEEQFSALLKKDGLQDRMVESTRSNLLIRSQLSPPDGAVLVSLNHLRNFKKLAMRQMEEDGQLISTDDEPLDKRTKDDRSEDGEAENLEKTEIICLDFDEPSTSSNIPCSSLSLSSPTKFIGSLFGIGRSQNNGGEMKNLSGEQKKGKPLQQIEEQQEEEEDEQTNDEEKENNGRREEQKGEGGRASPSESTANGGELPVQNGTPTDEIPYFNDDLLCRHSKLAPNVKRIWLTREEWGILSNNFFKCHNPIPCHTAECTECIEESQALIEVKESNKKQLEHLLADLQPLLRKWRDRKNWESHELGMIFDHVICQKFVDELRNVQNRLRSKNVPEIPRICQDCLLCALHNRPYLSLENGGTSPVYYQQLEMIGTRGGRKDQTLAGIPITDTEWNELLALYKKHAQEHSQPREILLQDNGQFIEFCDNCHIEHNMLETRKRFFYPEGADIYVKKKDDESEEILQEKAAAFPNLTVSTRRNTKEKGLMKFRMRSDEMVSDLKNKLYARTNQSPNDQLLYRDGQVLEADMTLEMAEVPSNNIDCPLILIVQQRSEDGIDPISVSAGNSGGGPVPRTLEKGFKDTALSA